MGCALRHIGGLILTLLIAAALAPSTRAEGEVPVSIELVLAVDASLSVDNWEFGLQMRGIAEALRHPDVIALIGQHPGGIAMALVQWSGSALSQPAQPWRLLTDEASIRAYAAEVEALPRAPVGYFTAIGSALDHAVAMLEQNAFAGRQRKIDVSGDGRNNAGPGPEEARKRALARDIAINGLAILTDDPELDDYYRQSVAGGPGAFVITALAYVDFANAMTSKLIRELNANIAGGESVGTYALYQRGIKPLP